MKDIDDKSRNFKHCKQTPKAHDLMPHSVVFTPFDKSLVETGFEPPSFLNIAGGESNNFDPFFMVLGHYVVR
ncbi:hypothetical protein TNCV_4252411 [Trichonephila clavipes]|nr:hypothetical protein TNCV_4252411 [Trichonephila clavipes]